MTTLCQCFGVFGKALASRTTDQRALCDQRGSYISTIILEIGKVLAANEAELGTIEPQETTFERFSIDECK